MKMFNMIGIGERAGSGVPDIYAVWAAQGWIAPTVEEQYNPDRTILTLSFIKRSAEKSAESAEKSAESVNGLSERQKEILSLMEYGREYRAEEIAELIGLKGSRTRQLLKELVDLHKIGTTADTKMRRYFKAE